MPIFCSVEGCNRTDIHAKGMCNKHYLRFSRHGDENYVSPSRARNMGECSVDGCHNKCRTRGWCVKHYANFLRYGVPDDRHAHEEASKLFHQYPELYNCYHGIKQRCLNPSYKDFYNYGGRGIKMCDRWLGRDGFKHFVEDMGSKPTDEHETNGRSKWSIDRIDPNGDYCPENCRWADRLTQANNKRNNIIITINEKSHTFAEWCKITGINENTARTRYHRGWDKSRLFDLPK